MKRNSDVHPETATAQALGWVDETTKALVPPMYASTTYERDADNEYRSGFSYTRGNNPTYAQVEALLAKLEGAEDAMILSSGMSAATAPFLALRHGDHVLVQDVLYWGVRKWLNEFSVNWGLELEYYEASNPASVKSMVKPGKTKLIWMETPANPTWECLDIAEMAGIAHDAGARLAVDSTCATPVITRPLEHGADIVMHSATKYLNGHSDVLAGALATGKKDEYWERIQNVRKDLGTVIGPMEAWLLLRGMRTLHIRVERASANAMAIAERFKSHPKVDQVLYPGLPDHPSHEVAKRQMSGGLFGGMMAMRINGGMDAAVAVAAKLEIFKRATSLGGVESLVEHRASIEGEGTPVPDDLLRFSVGIEHADDLIADIDQALASL